MNPDVGRQVRVLIPGRKRIERLLHEDHTGLFVNYEGEKMKVVPELNFDYEPTGDYIKHFKTRGRKRK